MTDFADLEEPWVVLPGLVLPPEEWDDPEAAEIVIGASGNHGVVCKVDPEDLAMVEYFRAPRSVRAATEFLNSLNYGDDEVSTVDELVKEKFLIRVDPGADTSGLSEFSGVRLVPLTLDARLGEDPGGDSFVVQCDDGNSATVGPLLLCILYVSEPGEDFPTASRRLGAAYGISEDRLHQEALRGFAQLLESGAAYLEWCNPADGVIPEWSE